MFKMPETIEYALPEQIGEPDLFVGRKTEFDYFLGDWYRLVKKNFAQNQAIISRRKKGKTAFLQRLFNILWSAGMENEAGQVNVIPFYYSIRDTEISLGHFALDFFTEFVKCYCSYQQRNKELLSSCAGYQRRNPKSIGQRELPNKLAPSIQLNKPSTDQVFSVFEYSMRPICLFFSSPLYVFVLSSLA